MVDSTEVSQAWVFGHRLLPREAYTHQRRFLLNLRRAPSAVLSKLWAEAATGLQNATRHLPKTVAVVRFERIGALDFVVVQLPPPVGPGSHFIGVVFSQLEGKYVDEVEDGTLVYTWRVDREYQTSPASLRFIGADGFAPARPGTKASIATGGGLGFFDDPSLEGFVRAVKERHARPSAWSGIVSRVRDFATRVKAEPSQVRWRRELLPLSLLLMGVGVFKGLPAFLDGLDGRSPASVTCAELEDRRVRRKHVGHYVVLRDCEASPDEMSGMVHLSNSISELQLALFAAPRKQRSEPVVWAVIRRYDLVSPFSRLNESQARAMRDGTFLKDGLPIAEVNAVTEARAKISEEVASGMGGVLEEGGHLMFGEPPGFGLAFGMMFVVGGLLTALALVAPQKAATLER